MTETAPGPQEALPASVQARNAAVYAALWSLIFLSAPALYVGFTQAALCKRLHASDTLANLPSTVYLLMQWCPVIVAWLYPQARFLKRGMSLGYAAMALAGAVLALALLAHASEGIVIGALVAHATVVGCANGITFIFNWEALDRGVSERLRGKAMALAFGWGPGFAVLGSLGAQLLLQGKIFGWQPPPWTQVPYPYNYALLFGASAVFMGVAASLVWLFQIPLPPVEAQRRSFRDAIWGGFKSVLSQRVLLIACVSYILVYCGNMVQNNMSLFTKEAVGRTPEDLAGYELALRFGFKMLAGFYLGWLLTRTNAKAPLLVTAGLQIAGVLWVMFVPGYWFLLAFGINGAGELFGAYYVNYPVCCSAKSQVRSNVAFLMLFSSVVGLAPIFYGWISDRWGLRASFGAALALLVCTTAMVVFKLPARPQPPAETAPAGGP